VPTASLHADAAAAAAAAVDGSGSSERADLVSQVQAELSSMKQAVAATPADPITRPGDGIGIYSPGFKALGEIGELVSQLVAPPACGSH